MLEQSYINIFTRAYIQVVLENEEWPLGFIADDWVSEPSDKFNKDTINKIKAECLDFINKNEDLLEQAKFEHARGASECACDFWLTRNGHGAGFWCRQMGELGDKLTKSAESYGENNFYIENDLIILL